jgi:N-acetylmuramoyl-L-alanine amidase
MNGGGRQRSPFSDLQFSRAAGRLERQAIEGSRYHGANMRLRSPARPIAVRTLRLGLGWVVTLAVATVGLGQPARPPAPSGFTVLTREGTQTLNTTIVDGQEVVLLDDLARIFAVAVREDTLAGGLTLSTGGRTLVLSTSQGLASAAGRLVSLSGPPVRQGRTWVAPLDTLGRALPLLLETRIDVRRDSRLVVVGDVRVPRVTARVEPAAGHVRITFTITPATPHVVEQDANRLIVRFEADRLDAVLPATTPTDLLGGLRQLEGATAVAVHLGAAFASFRASDQPIEPNATRLTLELVAASGPGTASAPPTAAAPPPMPEPPPLLFEPPTSALRTIVIDPGHGGDETGAKGPGGTFEKDIVLAVARHLRTLLESRLGVRVLLTRDGDQTVALDQRAALANNNKADVFVSLHVNASVRESARGAEVFYLSAGEYKAEARQQAALPGELLTTVGGADRRVEMILWEMAQLQHLEDSATLATIVERRLRERIPMSIMAIQQAPFRVLVGANMPAVLVEMGFVTNPEEEKLLTSSAHQVELAQVIYESLVEFRSYLEGGRRPAVADAGTAPAGGGGAAGGR